MAQWTGAEVTGEAKNNVDYAAHVGGAVGGMLFYVLSPGGGRWNRWLSSVFGAAFGFVCRLLLAPFSTNVLQLELNQRQQRRRRRR